jgi:3-oxoadipate enol-lactonase
MPNLPAGSPVTIATTIPIATSPDHALPPPGGGADGPAWFGGEVRDVPVPGGFIRTESLGRGPPLLLLHGWALDRRIWAPQTPLAASRRLILLDRRGFGQSSAPPALEREPEDVLAVVEALALERYAIGGLSQGARVAIHTALRTPERVTRLVLMGAPLDGLSGSADPLMPFVALRQAALAGDRPALLALFRAHPFMKVRHDRAAALLEEILGDYRGLDLQGSAGSLPLREADAGRLTMKVTAMAGADDTPHRQAVAKAIAQGAPRGTVRIVAGAGHLLNLDQPDLVNAELDS